MKSALLSLAAWAARRLPLPVKRALYRFPPLARLIRASLNRAAPAGVTNVEIAAGALAGMKMQLDLHAEKDYWLGTYETELQAAVAKWVQPGMVAYDVGANIGYISLLLARQVGPKGRVFCFEALPANLERLQTNIELNALSAQVKITPGAVLDRAKRVRFLVGPSDDTGKAEGSAGRQDFAYTQSVEVQGLSLDEFVYQSGGPPPQVIKIDIEGGEVLALPGMQRVLQTARPLVLLEMHGPEAAHTAWETLSAAGYTICRMENGYPVVNSVDELDWKAYLLAYPRG